MDDQKERKIKIVQSNYDIVLIMLILLLSIFGLIMIYSTSSYNAARYYDEPKRYFNNQGRFLLAGFAAMLGISMIDYRIYIKPIRWLFGIRPIHLLYILCIFLQIYVLVDGYEAGGSSRWIKLPGGIGGFQPSEVTKICIILFVAYLIQRMPGRLNHFSGFFAVGLYVLPLLVMVAKQNLSTAIIMAGILTAMCFVVCRKKWYFFWVFLILIAGGVLFIVTSEYRLQRVIDWSNAETLDPSGQIMQGLYAIASGGLWGKGLGESSQKLGYIPEVHTDMIFTIICEELGIFGAIMVIAVVLMMLWRLLVIAVNAPDMFGGLIATGVLIHIALQVMMNVAVVTNSIPATGVPFPFISYGGSSLMVLMAEMGIVLSVSKYTNKDKTIDEG